MSTSGPGAREVAYRLFGAEFDDASLSYSESDEERAPNYVVTPTGARVNRLFVAGVLTEVERINEDTRRGRVVDPSGAFVTYAGQYQPDAQAFLERSNPPAFVALTGKARTFEPEDSNRVFTSVRPESINEVDADTRDRWIVTAAETTLDRLAVLRKAMESDLRGDDLQTALEAGGAPEALATGIPRAIDHYRTSPAYVEAIRQLAVDALELVAGDRDEVRAPEFGPDAGGHAEIGPLPKTDVTVAESAVEVEPELETETVPETETPEPSAAEPSEAEAGESEANESEPDVSKVDESEPDVSEAAESEPDVSEADESEPDVSASEPTTAASSTHETANAEADAAATSESTPETDEPVTSETEDDTEGVGGASTSESEGLGDFDAAGSDSDVDTDTDIGTGEADSEAGSVDQSEADESETDAAETDSPAAAGGEGEMYELDEEERTELEEEFGTEFATGGEVEEAGIDVPDADELAEELDDEAPSEQSVGGDSAEGTVADEPDQDVETDDTDLDDVDLTDVAVETMKNLDDGDGADHDAVVAAVVDEYGADPGDVEDAIQDALMGGQCYEPGEGTLKAI